MRYTKKEKEWLQGKSSTRNFSYDRHEKTRSKKSSKKAFDGCR